MYFGWEENRKCNLRGREGEDGIEWIDKWCVRVCVGEGAIVILGARKTRVMTTSSNVTGPVDGRARKITPFIRPASRVLFHSLWKVLSQPGVQAIRLPRLWLVVNPWPHGSCITIIQGLWLRARIVLVTHHVAYRGVASVHATVSVRLTVILWPLYGPGLSSSFRTIC